MSSPEQADAPQQFSRRLRAVERREDEAEVELREVASALMGIRQWADGATKALNALGDAVGRSGETPTGLYAELAKVEQKQQEMSEQIALVREALGEPPNDEKGVKGSGVRWQIAVLWRDLQQRKMALALGTGMGTGVGITLIEVVRLLYQFFK